MRLLIVPLALICLLIQAPTPALGNANQQAAEKIANTIGERFPDADIDVSYRGGQVWLKGEAASKNQHEKIVKQVFEIPGIAITEIVDEIQIVASGAPVKEPAQPARQTASAFNAAVPMPNASNPSKTVAATPNNARQAPQVQTRMQQAQQQPSRQPQAQPQVQPQHLVQQQMQQQVPAPQTMAGALLAPYPQAHSPAVYGQYPGQQPAVPVPFAQTSYVEHPHPNMPQQPMTQQPMPQYAGQYPQQYHPAYYGPPAQAAYHPEAYGPQGPLPGQYNQPNLPDYAWPAYANYPNYAQVSYPRNYSPKAWPYIGPFYPYPQVPMGWRKVTLEHSNGWWWLDFDDGTPSGPFSGLFRQPQRYTY